MNARSQSFTLPWTPYSVSDHVADIDAEELQLSRQREWCRKVDELIELLRPFVGERLTSKRTPEGYVIPRQCFVDIRALGINIVDADIRAIGPIGIECITMAGFADLVAWDDVRSVTVRGEGGGGPTYDLDFWRAERVTVGMGG